MARDTTKEDAEFMETLMQALEVVERQKNKLLTELEEVREACAECRKGMHA